MSWTYSGNPALNPRDAVRFNLGDTIQTTLSLTDEEIDYLLATLTPGEAKAQAAEAMAARYTGKSVTSKKVGDLTLSFSYAETATRYEAMAARFRKSKGVMFLPVMGDTEAAVFSVGMDDYAD